MADSAGYNQEAFALAGKHYGGVLTLIAKVLSPRRFFEIGTRGGQSLRQFPCDAVCVDPRFYIRTDPILTRKRTFFFQQNSDDFFSTESPSELLRGPIDISFLDGFHRFEFLLRDFINTERHCHAHSLIIMHDCLPPHPYMTRRSVVDGQRILDLLKAEGADIPPIAVEPSDDGDDGDADNLPEPDRPKDVAGAPKMGWAGDVYRMMFALKKYRPELRVHYLDCPPTGMVIATGLNPSSTVLSDRYFDIVDDLRNIGLNMAKMRELFNLHPTIKTREITQEDYSAIYPTFS